MSFSRKRSRLFSVKLLMKQLLGNVFVQDQELSWSGVLNTFGSESAMCKCVHCLRSNKSILSVFVDNDFHRIREHFLVPRHSCGICFVAHVWSDFQWKKYATPRSVCFCEEGWCWNLTISVSVNWAGKLHATSNTNQSSKFRTTSYKVRTRKTR